MLTSLFFVALASQAADIYTSKNPFERENIQVFTQDSTDDADTGEIILEEENPHLEDQNKSSDAEKKTKEISPERREEIKNEIKAMIIQKWLDKARRLEKEEEKKEKDTVEMI